MVLNAEQELASSAGFHSVALYSFAFSVPACSIIEVLTFKMRSPGLGIREGIAPLKVQVALLFLRCIFLQLWIGKSSMRAGKMASSAVVD